MSTRHGSFWIAGVPAPKGSTRSFVSRSTGRVVTLSDCGRLASWEATVRDTARAHGVPLLDGPVKIDARFYVPRPKRCTRKFPTVRPDSDKMLRALYDGCEGVLFRNDAQVIDGRARKVYADPAIGPGCFVAWREVA